MQAQTSCKQKIALALFGVFLSLTFLEIGMRLAGFIVFSLQEYQNLQSIKQKDSYRILCLGESTTQGEYPHFLEQSLNQRNTGVSFSVIDKGRWGTNTSAILSHLESYLTQYHPDMVVVMMGINDFGEHMPYEAATSSRTVLFLRSFRVYKLARMLWLHIAVKIKELAKIKLKKYSSDPAVVENSLKKFLQRFPQDDITYTELGKFYREQGRFFEAEAALRKAVEINPRNKDAYLNLGWVYRNQTKFLQVAEDSLKRSIALDPKNSAARVELARLHDTQGQLSSAETVLIDAIEADPNNDIAYDALGRVYSIKYQLLQAEAAFRTAIEINPDNEDAYVALAGVYRAQNKFAQAQDLFEKEIKIRPGNVRAYIELGWLYCNQDKLSQAQDLFKKAIEIDSESDRAYGAISVFYDKIGKHQLAQEYSQKANRLRLNDYTAMTINNYRRLKEILDGKRIKLVCVQYPMRSIEQLKKILPQDKGTIFVDNEEIFKEALHKTNYREYFRDMFGGDFGHCTEKGNRLLAQNIADTIIRNLK